MKRLFLFCWIIISLNLSSDLYSQTNMVTGNFESEVMKNSIYQDGIYANIQQFLNNTPEEVMPITIRGNRLMYNDGLKNQLRVYTKTVWCVCINNQVYLKHLGKFVLVQISGRFSFFEKHRQVLTQKGFPFEGSPFTRPDLKTVSKQFFIDFKTDKRYKLNTFNVENILRSEDTALYNEFMATKHRKYFLSDFIAKLNN